MFVPVLQAVHVIISDGDQQIIDSIAFAKQTNLICSAAEHLLCYWHTIHLYLEKQVSFLTCEDESTILLYCKNIAKCVDKTEVSNLMAQLKESVKNFSVTHHQQKVVLDVLDNIMSKQSFWCRAWFPTL